MNKTCGPISLTPAISKILESLIGRWILADTGDGFDRKQFGALKGRSTSHALVDITHKWLQALDEKKSVIAVFVDYAKAFDHVDHTIVMTKLAALGVRSVPLRWLHSFLLNRQRVKIGDMLSEWLSPNGSMPQGTWLGAYVFLAIINDLQSPLELHKYIDDCTMSEFISGRNSGSIMQREINELNNWSKTNLMNINTKKTKEMIIGPANKDALSTLKLNGQPIERVRSYKLLGLHVTDTMKWQEHVTSICSKAAKRLHFLRLLKKVNMSTDDLFYYYQSVIRPVTEYACVVWHSSLTQGQSQQLETIQRRAIKIIHGNNNADVSRSLEVIPTLSDRREKLTRQFFYSLLNPSSCLHELIPAERDNELTTRLRHYRQYSPPYARTERFKNSTIVYALNNYQ